MLASRGRSNIFSVNENLKASKLPDVKSYSPYIRAIGATQNELRASKKNEAAADLTKSLGNLEFSARAQSLILSNAKGLTLYNNPAFSKALDNKIISYPNRTETTLKEENKDSAVVVKDNLKMQGISSVIGNKTETADSKKEQQIADISHEDKGLIAMYFRHRFQSFLRLAEERSKQSSQGGGNKSNEIKKNGISENYLIITPLKTAETQEVPVIEEIWKNLKRLASTKSKFKERETANYEKRVENTLKQLMSNLNPSSFGATGKNGFKAPVIELNDEKNSPEKKYGNTYFKEAALSKAITNFHIKKNKTAGQKIFIVIGGYQDLKDSLLSRGWIENPDKDSNHFHLKFTLKKADLKLNVVILQSHQYVNHYDKNTSITTKNGLCRNIRNLIWHQQEDIDAFYPRCFDLNDSHDFEDFVEDFKFSEAEKTLKSIRLEGISKRINSQIYVFKVLVALYICDRRLKDIDETIKRIINNIQDNVSLVEWEVLNSMDLAILTKPRYQSILSNVQKRYSVLVSDDEDSLIKCLQKPITNALSALDLKFSQSRLNTGRNIWIVKPASLSRGRGIACYDNLPAILNHIKCTETDWVAQKYLENLLVVKNRKFDIRQWVLVTDWAPLTVWFYDRCYIRFTADEYDPQNLSNKFAHLTNNSIAKHSNKFDGSEIEGNMWTDHEFAEYLKDVAGKDVFKNFIKAKMMNSVVKSLISVQEMVENRQNSFELFGYDFMVDEDYTPWLIEINSSPSMDYSTVRLSPVEKITEKLVKKVLDDLVKVVVDVKMANRGAGKGVNTGDFRCIFRGNSL